VDRVYKAEPAAHEVPGESETEQAGSQSYKNLQHIKFPDKGSRAVTVRNVGVKDSASPLQACRKLGMRIASRE
jgi:hypothetical protein